MATYIAVFLIALTTSLVVTPLIRRLSIRLRIMDIPRDNRRLHNESIPRAGGTAILLAMLIAISSLVLVDNDVTRSIQHSWWQLLCVFVPGVIVWLVGLCDDVRGTRPLVKLCLTLGAAILFYFMGGRITSLSVPFTGSFHPRPIVAFLITVVWVMVVTHAFNLIDGLDGLATGTGLFASMVVITVSLVLGHPHITVVALALCGALAGFFRYNFSPAQIFLGDSGALFIGFTLASISLQGTQKASTTVAIAIPVIALGFPLTDVCVAVFRRFLNRKSIFRGDKEHIHHMLLARGWSQRHVMLVLCGVTATLGLTSLLLIHQENRITGLLLLIVGSCFIVAVGHLRYLEIDEIKASLQRNVGDRRARAANHLAVRRAAQAMSQASSLSEIIAAVNQVLELGAFAEASVCVGRCDDLEANERLLRTENGGIDDLGIQIRDGLIFWSWSNDNSNSCSIRSPNLWRLTLPLHNSGSKWGTLELSSSSDGWIIPLDINYLTRLFHHEMAQAVERVLTTADEPLACPPFIRPAESRAQTKAAAAER